jgi:hypothetical protein
MRTKQKHKVNVLTDEEYKKYILELSNNEKLDIPDVKEQKKD